MRVTRLIILAILMVAGNMACRSGSSCVEHTTQRKDGGYFVFERGIDDVGIVVENVVPAVAGNSCPSRQQTNYGRFNLPAYKSVERYFSSIKAKTLNCFLVSANRPRTLYFIFALHRMRD
ncbi:MAG: hypothetical protein KBT41_07555 [bacterium]|nr:hypothetical protein [Candidatus Colousia faecequi]